MTLGKGHRKVIQYISDDLCFLCPKHLRLNSWSQLSPERWVMVWRMGGKYNAALLFFKVVCQISRSHGTNNRRFWPESSVSGLQLQFEFIDNFEMMHKAWSSMEEVPYCFSRSSFEFQGQAGQDSKSKILTQIEHFWTVIPVRIHGWLWKDAKKM